jgi:glycosyltransferase involved in cell wall biosynthesis
MAESTVFLSVIIPTRNRVKLLKNAIASIVHQTYQQEKYEIIIIDNGSTDETKSIVESFQKSILNLKYIYEESPGLHIGRHLGLKYASGEILVYADDDIEAFPTWLEGISESFSNTNVVLVGGNISPHYENPPPDWIESLWQTTPWGKVLGAFSILDFGDTIKEISPFYVFGCNFSIRKKILVDLGGFHPDGMPDSFLEFRGDGETAVSRAIYSKKYVTLFNPKASIYHFVPKSRMTFDYLYKRGYLQGISDSYTAVRKKGTYNYLHYIQFLVKNYIKIIKKILHDLIRNLSTTPRDIYYQGYLAGYQYHQKRIIQNPNLLSWILMKDYYYSRIHFSYIEKSADGN